MVFGTFNIQGFIGCSMEQKKEKILQLVERQDCDLLFITETWLEEERPQLFNGICIYKRDFATSLEWIGHPATRHTAGGRRNDNYSDGDAIGKTAGPLLLFRASSGVGFLSPVGLWSRWKSGEISTQLQPQCLAVRHNTLPLVMIGIYCRPSGSWRAENDKLLKQVGRLATAAYAKGYHLVVTGDLNCDLGRTAARENGARRCIRSFMDRFSMVVCGEHLGGGLMPATHNKGRTLDWILVSKGLARSTAKPWVLSRCSSNGEHISDHYPIISRLNMRDESLLSTENTGIRVDTSWDKSTFVRAKRWRFSTGEEGNRQKEKYRAEIQRKVTQLRSGLHGAQQKDPGHQAEGLMNVLKECADDCFPTNRSRQRRNQRIRSLQILIKQLLLNTTERKLVRNQDELRKARKQLRREIRKGRRRRGRQRFGSARIWRNMRLRSGTQQQSRLPTHVLFPSKCEEVTGKDPTLTATVEEADKVWEHRFAAGLQTEGFAVDKEWVISTQQQALCKEPSPVGEWKDITQEELRQALRRLKRR